MNFLYVFYILKFLKYKIRRKKDKFKYKLKTKYVNFF